MSFANILAAAPNAAASFARDGYLIVDLDLDDFADRADRIRSNLAPLHRRAHRIENAWRRSRDVRDLACLPQILDLLGELYGREAFPFQTLNFSRGSEQAPHSDSVHFDSTPSGYMAGVWIALEDVDAHSGPLIVYPGSHKLPVQTLASFGVQALDGRDPYQLYRAVYEPGMARAIRERGLVPFEAHLRKGQALVWAANLLHGGRPILDAKRTRHSQVTHYFFEGCSYRTPLLDAPRFPVDIRTGRNVGGEHNGRQIAVPLAQRARSMVKNMLGAATRYDR